MTYSSLLWLTKTPPAPAAAPSPLSHFRTYGGPPVKKFAQPWSRGWANHVPLGRRGILDLCPPAAELSPCRVAAVDRLQQSARQQREQHVPLQNLGQDSSSSSSSRQQGAEPVDGKGCRGAESLTGLCCRSPPDSGWRRRSRAPAYRR